MIRKALAGIPVRRKMIKGHVYLYQCIRAYRSKETGQVIKIERYLGAETVSRPAPIMDKLSATEQERIIKAWQDGEDIKAIVVRVRAYLNDTLSPVTVYKWFQKYGIPRKSNADTKTRQAQCRLDARREIEMKT